MDSLTLTFYAIAVLFGVIALVICIVGSIRLYRKGLKGILRLMLPMGMLAFFVLVQSISFLAANWPR